MAPMVNPTIAEIIIQKFKSKLLKIKADILELKAAQKIEIEFIIGMTIAINVRGIINCKSRNWGKFPPIMIPDKVAICQVINNVNPVPKRW